MWEIIKRAETKEKKYIGQWRFFFWQNYNYRRIVLIVTKTTLLFSLDISSELSDALAEIPYVDVAVVNLEFKGQSLWILGNLCLSSEFSRVSYFEDHSGQKKTNKAYKFEILMLSSNISI